MELLYTDSTLNIVFDTLKKGKQVIVFANTKSSAEKTAEEIAKKIKEKNLAYTKLSEEALKALSSSTKQCRRLAKCLEKGIAFHHAGLASKQKELIEDNFREKTIKVIACTPSLAIGVDLPAFRVVLKDLRRFGPRGLQYIPVLEYKQMCLPYHTKIMTDKGEQEIGNICESKSDSKVLSYNKKLKKTEFAKIEEYFINKSKSILKIQTTNGYSLELTSEHPVYTKTGWVKSRKLKIGDLVHFSVEHGLNSILKAHLYDYIPKKGTYIEGQGDLFLKVKNKLNITEKNLALKLGIDKKRIYHYKLNYKAMPYGLFLQLCGLLKYDYLKLKGIVKKVKTAYGKNVIIKEIKPDFFWLLGIIGTDGNLQKSIDKRTGSECIKIRVFNTNYKIIKKAKTIMKTYCEANGSITKNDRGLYAFEVGSTLLGNIINKHFLIPFKNKTSALTTPKLLNKLTKKCIGSYIAGVFDGDGSYTITKNKKYKKTEQDRVLFVSSSRKFMKEIQALLLNLGVVSRYYEDKSKKSFIIRGKNIEFKKPKYYVVISSKRNIKQLSKYMKPVKAKINVKFSSYNNLNKTYDKNEHHTYLEIKSIKKKKYVKPTTVYNIKVKPNNNYFASNFLVHNCGRAGRPKYDNEGQAIIIASSESQKEELIEKYIEGEPEPIYSKLAVEPVLRTYVLSLISTEFVTTKKDIFDFFSETFWAKQFQDMPKLRNKIDNVLRMLEEWEFISNSEDNSDFKSALDLEKGNYKATILGKRVAELYIDPYTANYLKEMLQKGMNGVTTFSLLHVISSTLEIRPKIKARVKDMDKIDEFLVKHVGDLLDKEPSIYEAEYDDFLNAVRTAMFFNDWIDEQSEEWLLEEYKIRPGEIKVKLDLGDWLVYCMEEFCHILSFKQLIPELKKLRIRLKNGVREELLALLKFKGIGRVRARKLFGNQIKDVKGVKEADLMKLIQILGRNTALNIKKQVGQEFKGVPKGKRIGQTGLKKWT